MFPPFATATRDAVALADALTSGPPALVRAALEPITIAVAQLEGELPAPAASTGRKS